MNQWSGIENIECKVANSTCPRNGKLVLEMFDFYEDRLLLDLVMLFILILLFRLLAFSALLANTLKK